MSKLHELIAWLIRQPDVGELAMEVAALECDGDGGEPGGFEGAKIEVLKLLAARCADRRGFRSEWMSL